MENFKYVLYLFTCGAKGEEAEIIKDADIKDIYRISVNHGIWNVIFPVIKKLYERDNTVFGISEKSFCKLEDIFRQSVARNIIKWQRLPEILTEISASGEEVCLLKGLTLGILYSEPYSRCTTDIDLLVSPEAEKKVCDILAAEGFNVMYKWEGSHHTKCTRADIGLVEIHTQLYDKRVQEVWFDIDKPQSFCFDDFEFDKVVCKQLNATDGLIFNFLHFIKHYISGPVTVKQLMDTMLYIKKYKENIDFAQFESCIIPLNYFELYKAFKCFAVKYLFFSPDELGEDDGILEYSEFAEQIFADLNKYAAVDTAGVYHIYTKSLAEKKNKSLSQRTTVKSKVENIRSLIWADPKRMESLYGESYQKIFFKPFLQLHRIFVRLFKLKKIVVKNDVAEQKELSEAADRIELLKNLGVL